MSNAKSGTTLTWYITGFILITTAYFFLKYKYGRGSPGAVGSTAGFTLGYFFFILILTFITNLTLASNMCNGKSQNILSVFMYTALPYFLILGSVVALISALPGWLSPFSNTIGYFLIYCRGLSKTFNSMIKTGEKNNKLLTIICSDESLVINEMTPDNYSNFMKTLSVGDNAVLKKEDEIKKMVEYTDLYNLVVQKNIIAEWIWYVMAGCLALTISIKSISSLQCEYSTADMKKTVDDFHDQEAATEAEEERKNKSSQYTVS